MKTCAKCKQSKERTEFHKATGRGDGLKHQCKVCRNASSRKWKQIKREKLKKIRDNEIRKPRFVTQYVDKPLSVEQIERLKSRVVKCAGRRKHCCHRPKKFGKFEKIWAHNLAALEAWKNKNGKGLDPEPSCVIPQGEGKKPLMLGRWCDYQRSRYRNTMKGPNEKKTVSGYLSAERIERLERIGFNWVDKNHSWERGFAALKAWKKEHGQDHAHGHGVWKEQKWCQFRKMGPSPKMEICICHAEPCRDT